MAREEERDPERREAAARASGEEEEEEGEEGLSDSDDEDEDDEPGSGREEEEEAAAAARRERSEDARLQRAGVPPAAVPAAAARDRSGRRQPGPPPGPLPCRPRMPSPDDEDRERRRSRRRDLLLSQLCFLALVALLLWSLSSMQEHNDLDFMDLLGEDRQWTVGRKLMQVNDTLTSEDAGLQSSKNCTEPALHEFPNDIFTNEDRRQGAVVLHVLCAMYMFYALAIVCDDFFVPSLEKICERLHLSEDVAGATFMAAGSSAPELFTSVIGVFITKGDVGVGTIVGSAVFNILCIIGVCGLFAGQVVALSSWCLLRDSIYYTLSVVALIVFIYDEQVSWWESLVLVLMYLVYIVIMKYNACIHQCFERRTKGTGNMVNGLANNAEIDDNSNCDATVVLLKKANFHRKASVIMVDELLSAYPHQLSFSEAGLRIMITSHFPPKTRLSMASRMLINERQRLINSRAYANGESEVAIKIPIKHTVENGTGPSSGPDRGVNGTRRDDVVAEAGNETENENEDNDNNENDEEEEEDEDDDEGPYTPFDLPSGKLETVKWAFTWPLSFVLYFTVPNCNKPRWEKWFMVTFASSTLWIAAFSYMMVWMVTIIGYTLGIPDVIMGITFLAAGTSVPDCMASLIVARQDSAKQQRTDLLRGLTPGLRLCYGVWRSPEQVAAGQEARVRVPFPVRCVPVLLHHDRVQRVHLCELAHVRGPLSRLATHRASVLLYCAIQDPAAPRVTRAPRAGTSGSPVLFTGLCSCLGGPGCSHPSLLPLLHGFLSPTPSCLLRVKTLTSA
ncbi:sodium/potassium/calcium exchanger 3 isoform X1 [Leopardus geoffroyi]|uniref:sodium/potassium/calcium exchanger 3 isoform X1 n=1 Tax=Leopardus geoffroyi TaxID=46844 RepID=UPI001E263B6A|nr:sodium/potassium/calcium exchanger 3 isoform X1 [Leopardus geoffroyi]